MKMREEEIKIILKLNICTLIWIFIVSGLLEISEAKRNIYQNELVYEIDPTSLPTFNLNEEIAERHNELHNMFKRDLRQDSACKLQGGEMQRNLNGTALHHTHTFASSAAMALTWVGEDDGSLLIVLSETLLGTTKNASVFRSDDYGVTYRNLTQDLGLVPNTHVIKPHNGLQRHLYDYKKVYLIGEGSYMYTSRDSGISFVKVDLSFSVSGELVFSEFNTDYLIALDSNKNMYVSKDNGKSWSEVKLTLYLTVQEVVWGVKLDETQDEGLNPDTADTIYFIYGTLPFESAFDQKSLAKSTDGGNTYTDILSNVMSFERKGKFLLAVTRKQYYSHSANIMISTDGGNKFSEIKLPSGEENKLISVVDIEDNRVFIHVHDKGYTGMGILYISDSRGTRYSQSLTSHFFSHYTEVNDFYVVKSMRGVYVTSQLDKDASLHTVITYNHGADWQNITRPEGVPCNNESKGCYLLLDGLHSVHRGINTDTPLSKKSAVGLILAHDQAAHALLKTVPDVFVSRDGGYSWDLALKGPHHYQIGDHGGLLVAVSRSPRSQQIVKFSFDEGRCWYEYTFADETFTFTGLFTGPSGKSSVIILFGYQNKSKQWQVTVIDFKKMTAKKCGDNDYELWKAHATLRASEGPEMSGCLLGIKETFMRLKKNSWCYNGYNYVVKKTVEQCTCTKIDYECDDGFVRKGASRDCVKDDTIVNKCLLDYCERNMSFAYRKLPRDMCVGGFQPRSLSTEIKEKCDEEKKASFNSLAVSVPVAVVTSLIVASVLLGFFLVRNYGFQRGGSYDKIEVWHTEVQDI